MVQDIICANRISTIEFDSMKLPKTLMGNQASLYYSDSNPFSFICSLLFGLAAVGKIRQILHGNGILG